MARFVPRKNLHAAVLLVVAALGGVSLWRCQEALGGNASSAFYFTHLRAWEFAMGGIVSFVLVRRKPGVVVGHLVPARKATERNARMMEFSNAQNAWTKQFNSRDNCYVSSGAIYPEKQCMRASAATDGGKPDVLVIGDSLAANLSTGMSAYWADAVNVDLAASPGCRPIFAATKTGPSCGSVTNVVFEKADLSHYELVILHGNFARPAHVEAIVPSIAKLRARGAADIVLLGPNVEYRSSVLDVLSKNESASHDVVTAELTALILLRNFAQEPHMQKAADAAKIKYVSLLKLRCPSGTSESCMHTMGADGDPITRDNIHLSRTSSVWTLSLVEQRVAPWKGLLKFRSPNAWP